MSKDFSYRDEHNSTLYEARGYSNLKGEEAPTILVAEVPDNPGASLNSNRVDLAADLAKEEYQTTPDKIAWYEQNKDGTIAEWKFTPTEYESRPYANDMTRDAVEEAEQKGLLKPEVYTTYTAEMVDPNVNQEALEYKINDQIAPPEPESQRLANELNELTMPPHNYGPKR